MELTPQDVKTIAEMRRWMQTNGQAATVRPAYTHKPPRMVQTPAVVFIKAPSGGIPGRAGTILGSVQCDVWNESTTTDQIQDSTRNITVYNWTTSAVCANGDRFGIAGWCNNAWYIIAEDCNDEGSTVLPGTGGSTLNTVTDAIDTSTLTPASMVGESRTINFTGTGTGSGPA
jgi:hypothetical protein